jgi:hypothetical protein
MLAVPFSAFVALPSLLFEDNNLLVFLILEDFRSYRSSFYGWGAESRLAVIDEHEHLIDLDLIAFISFGEAVHEQLVALFNSELTALGLYSGFHDDENRLKNHF